MNLDKYWTHAETDEKFHKYEKNQMNFQRLPLQCSTA